MYPLYKPVDRKVCSCYVDHPCSTEVEASLDTKSMKHKQRDDPTTSLVTEIITSRLLLRTWNRKLCSHLVHHLHPIEVELSLDTEYMKHKQTDDLTLLDIQTITSRLLLRESPS